ncbi:MAG: hypothetical protein HC817_02815 [Saprospiraceae bacterium]|nr:hypothetical protein [Saprospiraceae bacterium]
MKCYITIHKLLLLLIYEFNTTQYCHRAIGLVNLRRYLLLPKHRDVCAHCVGCFHNGATLDAAF